MKHRFINKKTGAEAQVLAIYIDSDGVLQIDGYDTVEDLANDYTAYEEYKPPKEPLIKDKKVRKAIRIWAEANYIEKDGHNNCLVEFDRDEHRLKWIETSIEFNEIKGLEDLEDGKEYTITELCGEEEK